jgi:hypothetical protein
MDLAKSGTDFTFRTFFDHVTTKERISHRRAAHTSRFSKHETDIVLDTVSYFGTKPKCTNFNSHRVVERVPIKLKFRRGVNLKLSELCASGN